MRISDWSSDVCSSDLAEAGKPHNSLLHAGEIQRSERTGDLRVALTLRGIHRNQPATDQITLRAPGGLAGIFSHELLQAGNGLQVRALDVDEQRTGSRIFEARDAFHRRSEEHTSELQSLMRISYAVFCLKKKK